MAKRGSQARPPLLEQAGPLREAYWRFLGRSAGLDLAFTDREPELPPDPYANGSFDLKQAEALQRVLEQGRGYTNWQTVGSEPVANYLFRLATVRRGKGPFLGDRLPPLQSLLDRHAEALAKTLECEQIGLPFPVFAGLYPTGEFNAFVEAVPEGALLLVNAGQLDLMFCVLKTNLAKAGVPNDPPLLSEKQATMVLAEAFNAYLFGDGSLRAWALPPLDDHRASLLSRVLSAGHHFVLAHELGHVACGHVQLPAGDGKARVRLSAKTELEADRFAVDLLARSAAFDADSPLAQYLVGGILNVIAIAAAVEALKTSFELETLDADSHPALAERWQQLSVDLSSRYPGADPLDRGNRFFAWLAHHVAGVAEWLRLVDQTMTRPGHYS